MESSPPQINFSRSGKDALLLQIAGDWKIEKEVPSPDRVREQIGPGDQVRKIAFDTHGLLDWDSSLLTFLIKVKELCEQKSIQINGEGLPEGARRLLTLA